MLVDLYRSGQVLGAAELLDNQHMKVVRFSALRTGRLYRIGDTLGSLFCSRLSRPQCHSAALRVKSMKNPDNLIGNRTQTFLHVAQCVNQLRYRVTSSLKMNNLFN